MINELKLYLMFLNSYKLKTLKLLKIYKGNLHTKLLYNKYIKIKSQCQKTSQKVKKEKVAKKGNKT